MCSSGRWRTLMNSSSRTNRSRCGARLLRATTGRQLASTTFKVQSKDFQNTKGRQKTLNRNTARIALTPFAALVIRARSVTSQTEKRIFRVAHASRFRWANFRCLRRQEATAENLSVLDALFCACAPRSALAERPLLRCMSFPIASIQSGRFQRESWPANAREGKPHG